MTTSPLRVGLFGIGLDAYWPQFSGLKDRLEGYLGRVAQKLARPSRRLMIRRRDSAVRIHYKT